MVTDFMFLHLEKRYAWIDVTVLGMERSCTSVPFTNNFGVLLFVFLNGIQLPSGIRMLQNVSISGMCNSVILLQPMKHCPLNSFNCFPMVIELRL